MVCKPRRGKTGFRQTPCKGQRGLNSRDTTETGSGLKHRPWVSHSTEAELHPSNWNHPGDGHTKTGFKEVLGNLEKFLEHLYNTQEHWPGESDYAESVFLSSLSCPTTLQYKDRTYCADCLEARGRNFLDWSSLRT